MKIEARKLKVIKEKAQGGNLVAQNIEKLKKWESQYRLALQSISK
jgi:hypothetical protein